MITIFGKNKKSAEPEKWSIKRDCLELILESAKSTHPNEFAGMLRVEKGTHTISEVLLLPGTIQGEEHAIFHLNMLPVDFSVVGTIHSHPSPYPIPSDADLGLFEHFGRVHIIAAHPYNMKSWRAYSHSGEPVEMGIVD
ncbi:MAG: Mov34/MPN/PAD-1 family protein [Candidatus Thermoplasmatota archaeon]|nr:Mov34/MPN/PAD-1 family protein [Candidatus Thermoplasmatota archaeon]